MKTNLFQFLILVVIVFISCNQPNEKTGKPEKQLTIYFNGDIVTMEGAEGSTVEAVVTEEDRIVFAGSLTEADKIYAHAQKIDLEGNTMFPGFIEQHLHPFLGALTIMMPMIAPEPWELPEKTWPAAKNQEEYFSMLKAEFAKHSDSNEIFWAWGYHHYFHGDLNRKMLDEISNTTPIAIWHRSCHEFYVNSAFLKKFDITQEDVNKSSKIVQEQTSLERGHFLENGAMVYLLPKIYTALVTEDRMKGGLEKMVKLLQMNGVTAYNEPGALMDPFLASLYKEVLGKPDVPMYSFFIFEANTPYMAKGDSALVLAEKTRQFLPDSGKVRFLPKQAKLLADGAIISQLMQMKDGYLDGHKGEWMLPPDLMEPATKLFWDAGYQLHIHVNGDEGLDVVLNAIENRMKENPRNDHRTVIVHFANSTDEQVKRLAELGCIVSANPYYVAGFSDKYAEIGLGEDRAHAMVRLKPAEDLGVSISLHSDLPMGPADPLYLAWCATNRKTNDGNTVRPDLAISLHTAMKAITLDAAFSWKMENEIGSIKKGKKANFTILAQNPYKLGKEKLKDIDIVSIIFEGREFKINK